MEIDQWEKYLTESIREKIKPFGIEIDKDIGELLLTGSELHFKSNDVYMLYKELCELTSRDLVLYSYNDFLTIKNIAKCLYRNCYGYK